MAYRAVKKDNGVIIVIGNDENQTGNYPAGSLDEDRAGVWCGWTFEEIPTFLKVEGADPMAMRFKENGTGDGIELRTDEEVLAAPQG